MKENPMNPHIAALRCPHRLLDTLIERYELKNDAGLSRALEVAPPCISKIRRGSTPLSAEMMLRIHERFELPSPRCASSPKATAGRASMHKKRLPIPRR